MLDTASTGQTLAASAQQVIDNLQRARTEQVNKESAARSAKQNADNAASDAQASQDAAVSALASAQQTFRDQQGELDQLTAARNAAQEKLVAAKEWSAPVHQTAMKEGQTCIDCHKGIAHELPNMQGVDPGWKTPPELQGEQLPQSSVFDVLRRFAAAHEGTDPWSRRM